MLSWRFIHVYRHHFVARGILPFETEKWWWWWLVVVVVVLSTHGGPGRLLSTLLFVC